MADYVVNLLVLSWPMTLGTIACALSIVSGGFGRRNILGTTGLGLLILLTIFVAAHLRR